MASLMILNLVLSGRFLHRYNTDAPTTHMIAEAARVFIKVFGIRSNNDWPKRFRSFVISIITCKYEQMAVERAKPAIPIGQMRGRLSIIFRAIASKALLVGVFESCIE